jgi:hypothetical protein
MRPVRLALLEQLPPNVTPAGKANGHLNQVHAHAAIYHAKSVLLHLKAAVVRVMMTLL